MKVFDGFIAAIASEFKLKFHKENDGIYTTKIQFDNDRHQDVMITLAQDESGDRIINYYSIIGRLKNDQWELYKYALELNNTISYGSLALLNDKLVLRDSIMLKDCDPQRFIKSLTYIGAKADEFEELFSHQDIY